jgi:lytic murein transglycosylase
MRRLDLQCLTAIAVLLGAVPAAADVRQANCTNTGSFDAWMKGFRREAQASGVSPRTISAALDGITLDPGVIARDRKQTFFTQSFSDFAGKLATENRRKSSLNQIAKNKATFDRVEKEYGVPPAVLTAFWALESDFGAGMGKLSVLRSLATLAYDCRRGEFFRVELMEALRIIDKGDLDPADMIGSWAGELGQTQFLPSHYNTHAIDYDGDGRRDLFRSIPDIIASSAKFVVHLGWRRGEPWLEEVRVPAELPWDQADLAILHPRSKWAAWGVTRANGTPLPNDGTEASLLLMMGRNGPAFLAYQNFRAYTEWTKSLNYATTAAYLATRIDGAPPMSRGRAPVEVLDEKSVRELQQLLSRSGYDVGEVDGRLGAATRAAVKLAQQKFKLPADSYPTMELIERLR